MVQMAMGTKPESRQFGMKQPINYMYVRDVYLDMFRYLSKVGFYNKDGYFEFYDEFLVNTDEATEAYNNMLKSFNKYQNWVNENPDIPKKSKEFKINI